MRNPPKPRCKLPPSPHRIPNTFHGLTYFVTNLVPRGASPAPPVYFGATTFWEGSTTIPIQAYGTLSATASPSPVSFSAGNTVTVQLTISAPKALCALHALCIAGIHRLGFTHPPPQEFCAFSYGSVFGVGCFGCD